MGCLLRKLPLRRGERGPSAIDPNVGGGLTIYTNHPGGNLVQKHKTITFDVVGERAASYIVSPNQRYRLQRLEKWIRLKSQPSFLKRPKRKCANHLMFQPKFSCLRAARICRFFRVYCKLVACKATFFFRICNLHRRTGNFLPGGA